MNSLFELEKADFFFTIVLVYPDQIMVEAFIRSKNKENQKHYN